MADIYGAHFEYAGKQSRQYGLIIVNIETDRQIALGGNKTTTTIYNKVSKRRHIINDDYSDSALSFDLEIITENERPLELSERRTIENWLFAQNDYCKLYFDDMYGETYEYVNGIRKRLYLSCRFVNPTKVEMGGSVIGYKATLEADSNMFWQDAVEYSFAINHETSSDSSIITVNVDSDINDYTYPEITIMAGETGGDMIICNNTDDSSRLTKFTDLPASAYIIMDGNLNYINGQYYDKFANRNFIRLLNGENKLTIIGDVHAIKISFSNRRSL